MTTGEASGMRELTASELEDVTGAAACAKGVHFKAATITATAAAADREGLTATGSSTAWPTCSRCWTPPGSTARMSWAIRWAAGRRSGLLSCRRCSPTIADQSKTLAQALATVTVPIRWIVGDLDPARESVSRAAAAIPRGDLAVVPGNDHFQTFTSAAFTW